MDDVSNAVEPVQVFIRIRPENIDGDSPRLTSNRAVSPRRSSISSLKSVSPGSPTDFKCVVQIDEKTVRVIPPDGALGGRRKSVPAVDEKLFTFDNVFGEDSSQEELYNCVSAHIKATVRGYNTTIFAYGSTGSGKSYTMTGNSSAPGIIPRAISEVFSIIETTAAQESDVFFYVRISYVELYNNNFRNLLEFASKELAAKGDKDEQVLDEQRSSSSPRASSRSTSPTQIHPGLSQRNDKIEVRESQSAGVFLAGPNLRIPVTTAQEAFQLIAKGNKHRAVGSTQCNDQSSRSHAVLTLHVESRVPSVSSLSTSASASDLSTLTASAPSDLRLGKMHLVDLAGSERITLSGAEGDTLVETQNINLSLTALGDVLSALSKNATVLAQQLQQISKPPGTPGTPNRTPQALVPVPYRNSKLTHLLKDSLGGNSKTIMIANVRTLPEYYQQSAVTLMYASRAKKVRNRSLINHNVIGDTGIHAVTREIERLRSRLDERSKEFERLCHVQMKDAKENMALKARLQELTNANEAEKKQLEKQMSHIVHSQAGQLVVQREKFTQLQKSLQDELLISQERIAEQEKEIKFLKKALDETTEAQKQPVEQLERMKKVVEAWQSQAQTTQQELVSAVQQSEALRSHNATLMQDLNSARASAAQLMDELTSRTNEIAQKGAILTKSEKEREDLQKRLDLITNDNRDLKEKLKSATAIAMEKDAIAKELQDREDRLERDIRKWEQRSAEAAARITELEGEKVVMHNRLKDTISELEQRTAQTIGNANLKLKEHEEKRKVAEERAKQLEADLMAARSKIDRLHSDASTIETKHETAFQEAREQLIREREAAAKLEERAIKSERAVEEMKSRMKEELQEERKAFLKQREELLSSCEEDKALWQSQMKELEGKLRSDFQKEFTTKEQALLRKFSASENETRRLHEEKMQLAIAAAKCSHEDDLEKLRSENLDALQRLQDEVQRAHEQYESDLQKLQKSNVAMLQQREEEWMEEKKHEIAALNTEHHRLMQELEKKYDTEAKKHLSEQMESLTRRHNEEIEGLVSMQGASQERITAAMADMKEKHKEQLKTSLAAQKDKLEAYYEEKLAAAAEAATTAASAFEEQKRLLDRQAKENAKDIEIRLKSHYAQEIAALRSELLLEQEQLIAAARAEERESVLTAEKAKRKEMLRDIEVHHKKQMEAVRAEADEARHKIEEMHEERLQDLDFQTRSTVDSVVAAERATAEKKLAEKLSDLECALTEAKEREINELRQGYERDLQEAAASNKKALKDALASLEAKKDKEAAEKLARELADRTEESKVALAAVRATLTEQHKRELSEALNELNNQHSAELLAVRSETQSEAGDRFAQSMNELIERIGKENREALAAQKSRLEEDRKIEVDRLQERLKLAVEAYQDEVENLKQQHSATVASLRDALNSEMLEAVKAVEADKARSMELLRSEMRQALQQAKDDSQQTQQSLRNQMEALRDRHREELNDLRSEKLDAEVKHQRELSDTLEKHLAEMSVQRQQIESAHDKTLASLRDELSRTKAHYEEILSSASARQDLEAKALRDQHQEFDDLLCKALAEKDEHHRQVINKLTDAHALEVSRVAEENEREKSRLETEITRLKKNHELEIQKTESSLRDRLVKELAAAEDLHHQTVTAQLAELSAKHRDEVKAMRAEFVASEERAQRAILGTAEQQQELTLSMARMRAQFEREKAELSETARSDLLAVEERHRSALAALESKHREKLESLEASFQQRISTREEELTMAHSSELAELKRTHKQRLKDAEDAHTRSAEAIEQSHDEEVKRLNDVVRNLRASMETQHQELARQREELVANLETDSQAAIEALRRELQTEIVALKKCHADNVAEIIATHEEQLQVAHRELDSLRAASENKRREMEAAFKTQLARTAEQSDESREKLKQDFDTQLSLLKESQYSEIETIKAFHAQELQRSQHAIEDLKCAHESSLRELRESMLTEAEAMKVEQQSVIARLQQQNAEDLALQVEQATATQQEVLGAALNALREELDRQREEDLSTLSREAVNSANRLKAKLMAVEQKYADLEKAHRQSLDDCSSAESELALTRDELQRAKDDYEQSLSEERRKHDEELEMLHMELTEEFNQKFSAFQVQLQDLDNMKAMMAAAEQQCDILRESVKQMEQDLHAATAREEELQVHLEAQRIRAQELEEAKQHRDNEIAVLKANATILNAHYEEAKGTLSDMTNKIESVVEDKTRLHFLVSELEDARRQYEESKRAAELNIGGLEEMLRHAEKRVIDLEDAHRQDVEDHESSLQRISKLEQQLSEEAGAREALEASLAKLHKEKEIQEWSSAQAEINRLRGEVAAASAAAQEALAARAKDGERIQKEYLHLLQERIDAAMSFFKEQRSNPGTDANLHPPHIDAVHDQFLAVLSDLSGMWRLPAQGGGTESAVPASVPASVPETNLPSSLAQGSNSHSPVLKIASAPAADGSSGRAPLVSGSGNGLAKLFDGVADEDPSKGLHKSAARADTVAGGPHLPPNSANALAARRPSITSYSEVSDLDDGHDWEVDNESLGAASHSSRDTNGKRRSRSLSHMRRKDGGSVFSAPFSESEAQQIRAVQFGGRPQLPWTTPSLQSSPTDQLVAAIMDGDVQGVRTVVRSKGEDFKSDYWKDLTRSILPLHRAISGLHFHGSEKLLVGTLETLMHLGANPNEQDRAGNTALHKAIQVCTSKSVTSVVKTLLSRGASPSIRNRDGDAPMHSECKRVRTASSQVLSLLLRAGADPNSCTAPTASSGSRVLSSDSAYLDREDLIGGHGHGHGVPQRIRGGSSTHKGKTAVGASPLTLILMRGAAAAAVAFGDVSVGYYPADAVAFQSGQNHGFESDDETMKASVRSVDSASVSDEETDTHSRTDMPAADRFMGAAKLKHTGGDTEKPKSKVSSDNRLAGRGVWVRTAEQLVKAGARWDPSWRSSRGASQLHLLLSGFPPSKEDMAAYKFLLTSALSGGLSPSVEDNIGRNCLFALCERLSTMTADACPEYLHVLRLLLDNGSGSSGSNLGGSDRTGKTIFDIEEKVQGSCLSAVKPLLIEAVVQSSPSKENKHWANSEGGKTVMDTAVPTLSVVNSNRAVSSIVPDKIRLTSVGVGATTSSQGKPSNRYALSPRRNDQEQGQGQRQSQTRIEGTAKGISIQATSSGRRDQSRSYFSSPSPSASFSDSADSPMEMEISPSPSGGDRSSSQTRWNKSLASPSAFSLSGPGSSVQKNISAIRGPGTEYSELQSSSSSRRATVTISSLRTGRGEGKVGTVTIDGVAAAAAVRRNTLY